MNAHLAQESPDLSKKFSNLSSTICRARADSEVPEREGVPGGSESGQVPRSSGKRRRDDHGATDIEESKRWRDEIRAGVTG